MKQTMTGYITHKKIGRSAMVVIENPQALDEFIYGVFTYQILSKSNKQKYL